MRKSTKLKIFRRKKRSVILSVLKRHSLRQHTPEIPGKREKTEADVEMKGKMRRFYGQLLHFAWLLVLLLQDFHYGFRIETVIT